MDKRSQARISVDSFCSARFHALDRSWSRVRVLDLGGGGCRLRLAEATPEQVAGSPRLEGLDFDHPSLPRTPVRGEVVWSRRQGRRHLEVGVRFLDLPADYDRELKQLVTAVRNSSLPFLELTGMPD